MPSVYTLIIVLKSTFKEIENPLQCLKISRYGSKLGRSNPARGIPAFKVDQPGIVLFLVNQDIVMLRISPDTPDSV
jgi:hypothetical protein